jgi:putative transposase
MNNASLNLDAPPGFRGLHPDIPVTMYQRHLPHWRQDGATYFVTFRLAGSLPQQKRAELQRWRAEWDRTHLEPRTEAQWQDFTRRHAIRIEGWLDEGYGECILGDAKNADILSTAMLYFQDDRCSTFAFVVMPNHVHVVMKPLGEWRLEQILDSWKGFVGHSVNKSMQRSGVLGRKKVTIESSAMKNIFSELCSTSARILKRRAFQNRRGSAGFTPPGNKQAGASAMKSMIHTPIYAP